MASPRNNSTAHRGLEQQQPPNLLMSAARVTGPPLPPTRIPRLSHGPPPSVVPTYISNPFEEYVPLRRTAALGPDPSPSRPPPSRIDLSEPGPRTGLYLYPPDSRAFLLLAQSDDRTTAGSAGVAPAVPLPRQGNRTPLAPLIGPPRRTNLQSYTTTYQGPFWRHQTTRAQGAVSFGQRESVLTQSTAENTDPDSIPTFAPEGVNRHESTTRTSSHLEPRTSTRTGSFQLPAQAGTTGSGGEPEVTATDGFSLLEQQLALARAQLQALRTARQAPPPPAKIQHFSTLPANDPAHEPECAICQEPYDDKGHAAIRLHKVSCTHVFGHSCLQQWVNSGMRNAHRCPNCRQDITAALSRAVSATLLPTANGAVNPAHLQAGRPSVPALARRLQDSAYAQEQLYQALRAHEEARQALGLRRQGLGDRRVGAGFSASTTSREPAPSNNTRQAYDARLQLLQLQRQEMDARRAEMIRTTALRQRVLPDEVRQTFEPRLEALEARRQMLQAHHQELEARRQEMEVRGGEMTDATALSSPEPSDEARQVPVALHPQPFLRQELNISRLNAADPSRRTTGAAPRARRVSNATRLHMDNTLRSQAAEQAAFDADAARQTNSATLLTYEEATVLAVRISRERGAMARRHRDQIMAVNRHVSRADREREAEDEVLRR